jgi:Tir chaperone protein (CesT) family
MSGEGSIALVNEYLQRFGERVAVHIAPLDNGGFTDVRFGALVIGVNAVVEHGVLLILVRMGPVPEVNKQRLYRKLLELNFLATGACSFAIDDQREAVYLRAMRPLAGLDYIDFASLMENTAAVAARLRGRLPELTD